MNNLSIALITLIVNLSAGSIYATTDGDPATQAALDSTETTQLVFMREEEKLARDVYLTLYERWNYRIFSNISRSEQNHMDAMLKMLNLFGIDDPISSDAVGSLNDPDLAALYPQLIARGEVSLLEAFQVGGFIEELDIRDLRLAIAATDEAELINAYSNLLAASRNHLRNFVSHIENRGVDYQAQVLDQSDVDAIVGDYNVIPGEDFTINAGLNDAWYFPETDGQGFFVTVFPELEMVFLAWFTYDTERPAEDVVAMLGGPGQRWLTAMGPFSGGQAHLEIEITTGGVFDAGEPLPTQAAGGSILLQFDDCLTGSVIYDIPSIDRSGIIPIERMAPDNVALCEALNDSVN